MIVIWGGFIHTIKKLFVIFLFQVYIKGVGVAESREELLHGNITGVRNLRRRSEDVTDSLKQHSEKLFINWEMNDRLEQYNGMHVHGE